MKLSINPVAAARLSAISALFLVGCNASTNDLAKIAACSGPYAGVFTGDAVGSVTGSVTGDGTLHFEFVPSEPQLVGVVNFTYNISNLKNASFDPGSGDQTIDGTFNFDNCSLSGNWTLGVTDADNPDVVHHFAGTYVISKQPE